MSTDTPPVSPPLLLLLASPRGFCAGVSRAIDAVVDALRLYGAPVYVRRAIVHNLAVVAELERQGAVFVERLDQVPPGAVVILSAHGVPTSVIQEAKARRLRCFDAVCPLVAKVHREVMRAHAARRHVVLVGHPGHPEIIGTLGRVPGSAASVVTSVEDVSSLELPNGAPVTYAVQTTFSIDDAREITEALLRRFSDIQGPHGSDVCYATTNRQGALKAIAGRADAVLVAGESFSSNASRLAEVARASGCTSVQLVAEAAAIDWPRLAGARTLAMTAAASTPETTVNDIIMALRERYEVTIQEVAHVVENATFKALDVRA